MRITLVCLFCFCGMGGIIAQSFSGNSNEKLLAKIERSKMVDNSIVVNKNNSRVGFRMKSNGQQQVIIDGQEGPLYDSVSNPVFNSSGNKFIYAALTKDHWKIVVNNEEVKEFPTNEAVVFQMFSPSDKVLCIVVNNGQYYLDYDGQRSGSFDFINENSIVFSDNGDKLAYSVSKGNQQAIVYNGKEGRYFDNVGFPQVTKSGNRIAYWAEQNRQAFAVIDNNISKPYDQVINIKFSDDEKHIAYHAKENSMHMVVADGKESEKYHFVHSLTYSPVRNKLAYAVETQVKNDQGFNHAIVLDGKQQKIYETVVEGSLLFSHDGKHFAYEAEWHDEFFIVNDGIEGQHFNDIMQITMAFSPNGKQLGFAVENDSKRRININGQLGEAFDDIYFVAFSPDNSNYAFSARELNDEFVVVNNIKGKKFDLIHGQGVVVFENSSMCHYIAQKDDNIFLVTVKF